MKKVLQPLICCGWLFFLGINTLVAQNFPNPLPIPYRIDSDTIRMEIDEVMHNFNPNGDTLNEMVRSFAFNLPDSMGRPGQNTLLGPSLVWRFGRQVHTEIINNLSEPTTTHWHGAHVPQYADGGPHQRINADSTWKIDFEVMDKSATMWYHPHLMGTTYEHVQMGLSGMLYVEDPPDGDDDSILVKLHKILPVEYGVNDFPLIVQTKKLFTDTCGSGELEIFEGGFKKEYIYVTNGVMNPYLEVPDEMVRFRLLNGDAKWSMSYGVGDLAYESPETFQMIATDAGYMDSTYQMEQILVSPGERVEILMDLRGRVGDTIYVHNVARDIRKGTAGAVGFKGAKIDPLTPLVRLIVTDKDAPRSPIISFPLPLHPLETPEITVHTKGRLKTFHQDKFPTAEDPTVIVDTMFNIIRDSSGACVKKFKKTNVPSLYNIDRILMNMMTVNDTVLLDSTEVWTIDNQTDISHPFHIHDIHFFVTEIVDSFGTVFTPQDDTLHHIFRGPKDNVLVEPKWKLSFATTFSDFGTAIHPMNSYMYHCHILPHEDRGMMGQFVVWDGSGMDSMTTSTVNPIIATSPLRVYPNPASNTLNLEGTSQRPSQVRVFDLQGRTLKMVQLPPFDGVQRLDVGDLPIGMVFVEWISDEQRAMAKVLISR
ncbi:MAG: multicopper oxidase domain-containing protein [Bacteroidota bacterium]